jgi:hypothetical protein
MNRSYCYPTLLIFTLFAATIYAELDPHSSSLSSSSADYDGSKLQLKGKVVLDHGLGQMNAEEACLERQESGKDFPFSLIHLQKEVVLKLPGRGELKCDSADLDFVSLKGSLYAQKENKVIYTDYVNGQPSPQNLIRLMSDTLALDIIKESRDEKKTTYVLKTLSAEGDVIIDYAKAFTLRAARALYDKENGLQKGIITAYPENSDTPCHLFHDGDRIDTDGITLDSVHALLSLQYPRGTLLSPLIPGLQKRELSFKADRLLWDYLKNSLTLQGGVYLHENALGTIEADEEVHLTQEIIKGKRVLQSLRTRGRALFHYKDSTTEVLHRLTTYGPLSLDRQQLRLSIESPESEEGVSLEEQIHYEEAEIAIRADRASLDYSIVGNFLQPVSLNLKGNVRLSSQNAQYPLLGGLADRVTYSPATRTLILAANPGKRALFWDEAQSLRMTSQEIHIIQDAETKQRAVKGVGNVTFSFTAEEENLLKKILPNYK